MTENLIKALLSMKSVKEMRAHSKVRREGDMWKKEEVEDLNEIQERKIAEVGSGGLIPYDGGLITVSVGSHLKCFCRKDEYIHIK